MTRPFEQRFGYVKARIQTLEHHIHKDFILLQAMHTASMTHYTVDVNLNKGHFENVLSSMFPKPTRLMLTSSILGRVWLTA